MPVSSCGGGKYRIGSGKCQYKSKASANRAYAAYRAKKAHGTKRSTSKKK